MIYRNFTNILLAVFSLDSSELTMAIPTIFIGSSTENLHLAYAVQHGLEHVSLPTVWTQGIFTLSQSTLSSLLRALDRHQYAVFVFSPDDVTHLRNNEVSTVRDNVIFEFGLFIGRLGISNCYFIVPRGIQELHLPSDLAGITPASYDSTRPDGNWQAALGPAIYQITQALNQQPNTAVAEDQISLEVEPSTETYSLLDIKLLIYMARWKGVKTIEQMAVEMHEKFEVVRGRVNYLIECQLLGTPRATVLFQNAPNFQITPHGQAFVEQLSHLINAS
jgi:predicted nucleotide-binding protein